MRTQSGVWRRRLAIGGVCGLLAWQGVDSIVVHPDYLASFNALAGRQPERVLINGDLDWGQDLSRLAAEVRWRGIERIYVAYNGRTRLERHVPEAVPLPPRRPVDGWVAISLWTRVVKGDAFSWLNAHTPVTRVGRSIDLYHISATPGSQMEGAAAAGR
jgi:hypothetical protein